MNETGIKSVVLEELCQLAKQNNWEKVILFGSRAGGLYKKPAIS